LLLGTPVITGSALLSSFRQKLHLSEVEDLKDYKEKERDLNGQRPRDMKHILARKEKKSQMDIMLA